MVKLQNGKMVTNQKLRTDELLVRFPMIKR